MWTFKQDTVTVRMHRQKYEIKLLNELNILVYKTLSFLQKYFQMYIWIVDKDENIHILHSKI